MNYDYLIYRDDVKREWKDLTSLERKIITNVLLDINGDNIGKENLTLTYAIYETDTEFSVYWYLEMIQQYQITQALLDESMQILKTYKKIPIGRF